MCSSCSNRVPCLAQENQSFNSSPINRVRQRQLKKFPNGRRSSPSIDSLSSCSLRVSDCRSNRASQTFPIDRLPLPVLVHIAERLSFSEANSFRMVSRKFNTVERTARYSRKCLSFGVLSHSFPGVVTRICRRRSVQDGIGFLETATPMRMLLETTPSAVLTEVDLSSFSSFGRPHLVSVLKSMNARGLFSKVCKLNMSSCVVEVSDLEWLSSLMPEVWFVGISVQHIVLPNNLDDSQLDEEDRRKLMKMMGYCEFSGDCRLPATLKKSWSDLANSDDKRCLQIVALLTRLFPKLEVLQLE